MSHPLETQRGETPVYTRAIHTLVDQKDLPIMDEVKGDFGVELNVVAKSGEQYKIMPVLIERLQRKSRSQDVEPASNTPLIVPKGSVWLSVSRSNITIPGTSLAPFWEEVNRRKAEIKDQSPPDATSL